MGATFPTADISPAGDALTGGEIRFPAAQPTPSGRLAGRAIAALLFDLDGTLVETDDRSVERLAGRLRPLRRVLPSRDATRAARRVIMRTHDFFNRWLVLLDHLRLDQAILGMARRLGLLEGRSDAASLRPVAGTIDLVTALSPHYKLAIVSTRVEADLRAYLDHHGLGGHILAVIGSDSAARIKPHPEPLLKALELLGVPASDAAMVGDTVVDMEAARAAGVAAVGVLCGFGEPGDFDQADLVLESTADLREWLST